MRDRPGIEGVVIFSVVAYETVALSVNYIADKKIIPPITDMLGPLTHSKTGKIATWLFLGWAFDHFYKNGEKKYIERLNNNSV